MPHGIDRATYLARLGVDVEPGGRPPAPEPLRLVQQFVNSANHELGDAWDRLASVERARAWLRERGLLPLEAALTEAERRRLVRLRSALRAFAVSNTDEEALATLDRLAASVSLRVRFGDGRPTLEPRGPGADGAIGTLLAVVYRETLTGRWSRLKPCRECAWLFYDQSKNRSSEWCSMSVCGNRAKNRAYRGRRRRTTGSDAAAADERDSQLAPRRRLRSSP